MSRLNPLFPALTTLAPGNARHTFQTYLPQPHEPELKQEDYNYTMATGFAAADKTKPYIGKNSLADDRGYKDGNATATCMCGVVQLAFVSAYRSARHTCPI